MSFKSLCLAASLVLVCTLAHALISFTNPSSLGEYTKYSNIEVAGSTNNHACFGQGGTAKVRTGHVSSGAESGTTYQEGGITIPEDEGAFSKTLMNPTNGWPSSITGQTQMHAEVRIPVGGAAEIGNLNFYVAQDYP